MKPINPLFVSLSNDMEALEKWLYDNDMDFQLNYSGMAAESNSALLYLANDADVTAVKLKWEINE